MPNIKISLDIFENFITISKEIAKLPALVLQQYQAAAHDMYQICRNLVTANESLAPWLHRFIYFDFRQPNVQVVFNMANKSIRLRRAQMLRNTNDEDPSPIPAMSRLLDFEGNPILWLEEATVPRSGLRILLSAQSARWIDGKTYVWLGRKVLTGRGEGSSSLEFDTFTERS